MLYSKYWSSSRQLSAPLKLKVVGFLGWFVGFLSEVFKTSLVLKTCTFQMQFKLSK